MNVQGGLGAIQSYTTTVFTNSSIDNWNSVDFFVFSSSIYIDCNEQLKFCRRRMNNVRIYVFVSCDPLISNRKQGTREAGINCMHAATCKPPE